MNIGKEATQYLCILASKRVRGGRIHSSLEGDNPDWLQSVENPGDLYRACMKRVDNLLARYKYR